MNVPDSWGLEGKVAVVSGGGAAGEGIGNGRAAAILLARAGARVVVVDRDKALAQRTVEMIKEAKGGEAIALEADVTQGRECARMVQAALDTFGRLDLLDNNVGIGSRGSVVDETFTIAPPPARFIAGTACLATKNIVSTFTCITRRHSSSGRSTTEPRLPIPTLLSSRSRRS